MAALASAGLGTPSSVANMSEATALEVRRNFFFFLRLIDAFVDAIAAGLICGCFSEYGTWDPILSHQHVGGDGH